MTIDVGQILGGVRIVAVDDEPDIREVLARILERCGAHVTSAASAGEALTALARERPDVLIADINMPVEDGYSLMRRVRALGPEAGGNVVAIALTAHGSLEDAERAKAAGFSVHMPKPVFPAELVTLVRRLVGR